MRTKPKRASSALNLRPWPYLRTLRFMPVLLALFCGVFAPGRAAALATIDGQRIVVFGLGVRAVIERQPFRMRFEDAQGRTVLREVDKSRPLVHTEPLLAQGLRLANARALPVSL